MKRIFISVGSEGLKALVELINRLRLENVFNKFQDYYFAFDTDQTEVDNFNSLGKLQGTPRIKGFMVDTNEQEKNDIKTFRSWTVTIPAGGVGGDRTICPKALTCIKKAWKLVSNDLQPNDQIIVVGSAFGGTSGGMFLNVCNYLDLQIRKKRERDNDPNKKENDENMYKYVQVLGFLLMPDGTISSEDIERNYHLTLVNFISMFRDIQTISWQRRLQSFRPGFKVPTWAHLEDGYFPFFTGEPGPDQLLEYGISGSSLPMGTLYLVPTDGTNGGKIATALFAETLFVAAYLQIDMGHKTWIDRIKGQEVPKDLTKEDTCLAGFNMFTMKSGRMLSLKNWFSEGLSSAYDTLSGNLSTEALKNNIFDLLKKIQTPCLTEQYAGVTADEQLKKIAKELGDKTSDDELKDMIECASKNNGQFREQLSQDYLRCCLPGLKS